MSLNDPVGRLGRCARLPQSTTTRSSKYLESLYQDADCLSRHPVDQAYSSSDGTTLQLFHISAGLNIAREQRRDSALQATFDVTSAAPRPASTFRTASFIDKIFGQMVFFDLVISKHLQTTVLTELHDSPCSSHLGVRPYARVKQRFFWINMYLSIKRFVHSCDSCQRRKIPYN